MSPVGAVQRFVSALSVASGTGPVTAELLPMRLARATAVVLGGDGVGISLLSEELRVPLGSDTDTSATAERLQFTLGHGPCLQALVTATAVRATAEQLHTRWPVFHQELTTRTPYRSVVSLPLRVAAIPAAFDVYFVDPTGSERINLADAGTVAEQISMALQVAVDAPDPADQRPHPRSGASPVPLRYPEPTWLHGVTPRARMALWVALGMVNLHLHVPFADGLDLLRAYAYAHDQLLDDVAHALIDKTLPLAQLAL